jgi:hypothetical protein
MHLATLLILTTTLVLRTGDRLMLDGPARQQDGVVLFRSGGALYSIPASEIDETATTLANAVDAAQAPRRLKVSPAERDRLLRELQENHTGKPPVEQRWQTEPLPTPAPQDAAAQSADEWRWRREARSYEESVRRAAENRDMLLDRIDELRSQIRGFLSLGIKPDSFTFQTTQLAYAEAQVPASELEVQRAKRAWDQFRDDARRQGVLPGWLR